MSDPDREALVARHARGGTFVDVGCMWSVHGAIAFAAEAAGATAVTGVDVMAPTPEYEAEHARRSSRVRFVRGDLHDEGVADEVGVHDVVWCSGVLYHAPDPLLTLRRLRALTGETLILATEIARGRARKALFAPGPRAHPGLHDAFDPATGYAAWWWLPTASAAEAMVAASGFAVRERRRRGQRLTLVATPTKAHRSPALFSGFAGKK